MLEKVRRMKMISKPKMEKMASREFLKLSKKEQKKINAMRRIPVAKPSYEFDKTKGVRQKRWSEDAE